MNKKAWTVRGEMQEPDKLVIWSVADKNPIAARIFITGEAHEKYLGDAAVRLLVNINDVLYENGASQEPLFVETKDGTVRMTRFDPNFVWRCFHPDLLVRLVAEEAKRLHVDIDPLKMDCFDFYEEMVRVISSRAGRDVPIAWKDSDLNDYYSAVYLTSLLLFHKTGYLDIPVAQFFAQPSVADWMARADYRPLTAGEYGNMEIIRTEYEKIQGLTNPELNFIVSLYDRNRS